ncbi:MAG: amidase [Rubrivivax sp.]|jgi:aspartyl-tRNA(Asn)/glutamyl-tRNA(Gln) amidotransferase subunit A
MSPPLHALDTATLAALYRQGELSPVAVAQAVIAQVQRCEPQLHATYAFQPEAALAMARASEARFQQGRPLSPLDGVPVTVKENIATQGTPLPLGTAATVLTPAAADAPPAARLREAGAVLISKTTMPDYGMLSSGLSSFHALTRNPWRLDRNPGGSSAGAGAAAAAGYGPLHIGTDIGGSIRLPATWCGVVGFKPSNGRIPIQPAYLGRVAGPLARTVHDVALAMAELSRPDVRDATSLPYQALDWAAGLGLGEDPAATLRGLKVGLWLDAGWGQPQQPGTLAVVQQAARVFEAAGAVVQPLAPFATREATREMADGINRFWRMRSYLDIQALPEERRAKVLPFIRDWVAAGAGYSAAEVFHGYSQFAALRDATVAACAPFDVVLSPVAPDVAFNAEWAMPSNNPLQAMEHIAYTLPFNMSEQPAVSVPAGFDVDGLPVGVQLVGPRHADVPLLRVAHAFERLRAPLRPWPCDAAAG